MSTNRIINNVSSMKLLTVIQCVSNSPSKIRGGWGALILPKAVFIAAVSTPPPFGHPLLSKRGS